MSLDPVCISSREYFSMFCKWHTVSQKEFWVGSVMLFSKDVFNSVQLFTLLKIFFWGSIITRTWPLLKERINAPTTICPMYVRCFSSSQGYLSSYSWLEDNGWSKTGIKPFFQVLGQWQFLAEIAEVFLKFLLGSNLLHSLWQKCRVHAGPIIYHKDLTFHMHWSVFPKEPILFSWFNTSKLQAYTYAWKEGIQCVAHKLELPMFLDVIALLNYSFPM